MKYLGIEEQELFRLGGIHTAREIQQQPETWLKIYDQIKKKGPEIESFMNMVLDDVDDIILTGAGTSAYIGECLVGDFKSSLGKCVQAVPTTDIVTHPLDCFSKDRKVLLVSFARSGDSPESCAAVGLADQYSGKVYHLVITCNADGALVKNNPRHTQYNIILPEEVNDKSLAMTSSFSGMVLTGLLISRFSDLVNQENDIAAVVEYGQKVLDVFVAEIQEMAKADFKRAVFLGSGALSGIALEAHLKVQELSDGRVICKNDSYLGFRHGPKAVINEQTLVVCFMSSREKVHRYEKDLIRAIRKENKEILMIGISECPGEDFSLDLSVVFSEESRVDDAFLTICSIVPVQVLAFYKSLALGLKPDNPSVRGTINRVVEGVTIYE